MRTGVGGRAAGGACGSVEPARGRCPRMRPASPPGGSQAWSLVPATDVSPRCAPARPAHGGGHRAPGCNGGGRVLAELPPEPRSPPGAADGAGLARQGPRAVPRETRPAGGAADARRGCPLRTRVLRGGGSAQATGNRGGPVPQPPRTPPARPRSRLSTSPRGAPPIPDGSRGTGPTTGSEPPLGPPSMKRHGLKSLRPSKDPELEAIPRDRGEALAGAGLWGRGPERGAGPGVEVSGAPTTPASRCPPSPPCSAFCAPVICTWSVSHQPHDVPDQREGVFT